MEQEAPVTLPQTSDSEQSGGDFFVKSLERGLAVIRCFDAEHPRLTLADTAKLAGISRASARRFLLTLEALGYVATDGKLFWLTPKVLSLGYSYLSTQSLKEIAEPYLRDLSSLVGESVSLSVLDEESVVYLARVAARQIMTVALSVGSRLPVTKTSMGQVLLAGMEPEARTQFLSRYYPELDNSELSELEKTCQQIQQQGYVIVDQKLEVGLRAIAVPVFDEQGQVVASVNVSTRVGTPHAEIDHLQQEILPQLLDTAQKISATNRHKGAATVPVTSTF